MNKLIIVVLAFLSGQTLLKAQSITENSHFFPYFQLYAAGKGAQHLNLQNTDVKVNIDGLRAEVSVKQIYTNVNKNSVRAIYVFPNDLLSNKVTIDQVSAYQSPKVAPNTPNSAPQTLINNINPDAKIAVEWSYNVVLPKTDKFYTFTLSTIPLNTIDDKQTYNINVFFHTSEPINEITSDEHFILVKNPTINTAEVVLDSLEDNIGTRPFVLRYSLMEQNSTAKNTEDSTKSEISMMRGANTVVNQILDNQVDTTNKDTQLLHQNIKAEDTVEEAPEHEILIQYEVKENEYLEKIAQKHKITPEKLREWNHIKPNQSLHKGQKLKIHLACLRIAHVVEEDEYPYQIAQLYGVKTTDLMTWNGIDETNQLAIGQKLVIYILK